MEPAAFVNPVGVGGDVSVAVEVGRGGAPVGEPQPASISARGAARRASADGDSFIRSLNTPIVTLRGSDYMYHPQIGKL